MAYIKLPLGIRVALEFNWNGKPVVNIYHITTTDPITQIKLEDIAEIFLAWWETSMAGNVVANITNTSCTALNLDVPNGEKVQKINLVPVPGTLTGDSTPNNVAYAVSLKTALTGRSFQGRSFIGGLSELEVAGNNLLVARMAAILSAFVDLDAVLTLANSDLVVASFFSGGNPRAEGIPTIVTSFATNTRVDTQRRRLPKS